MNSKINSYQPVKHTFFNQRPMADQQAFEGANTLLVPQDCSRAHYLGLPLSELQKPSDFAHDHRDHRDAAKTIILDRLCESPAVTQKGFDAVVAALNDASDKDLHAKAMAQIEQALVVPDSETIEKPLALFQRLLWSGLIRPPVVDLSKYGGAEDGPGLQQACELVFRWSGLPKLSQAVGLRDVLGNETGTPGYYPPLDPKFFDSGADYSSRAHVGLSSRLAWNRHGKEALMVRSPLIPANMRCVTDSKSAAFAVEQGLSPVISMDYSERNRSERAQAAEQFGVGAFITVRTSTKEQQVAREVLRHGGAICIEMANANVPRMAKMVRELKPEFPHSFIMVGNVGSVEGYMVAAEAGADVVKLGRGPGAGCTTPEETGISPGQVTLAYECAMAQAYLLTYRGLDVPFILDGGISKPGHALLGALLGAETFMMGSFFAALDESPAPRVQTSQGQRVVYFGEASRFAQIISAITGADLTRALQQKGQGIVGLLSPAGSYEDAVSKFLQGLRGGVADLNSTTMAEVAGTEYPMIARTIGMGAAHETGTRLENARIQELTLPGRFDLGVGGQSEFRRALGIDDN